MLLYKAADLGMRLSAAFKSDTGIPYSDVNLQTHDVHQPPCPKSQRCLWNSHI